MLETEDKMTMEERLTQIEIAIANLQRTVDDLNEVIIRQSKDIDSLAKENKLLAAFIKEDDVKPLNEETPPPHY